MSTTAAIVIGVAVVVVLGALAFVTLARRSDVRGAGALSNETLRRDADARAATPPPAAPVARTAADAEAEGVVARTGGALVPIETDTGLTPWIPPDPEAIGVSRRQFFNRASVSLMAAGIGTFSAASMVAFLWPTATGGFGGKVPVGRYDDIISGIRIGQGFFYAPEARAWITAYPQDAVPKAEGLYDESLLDRHATRPDRAVPEVPAPRVPRAAVRLEPVVRVRLPRLAVQPGRREEGWSGAARHGPLPAPVLGRRRRHGRHRPDRRRHADRHQHHRPGGRGSALRGSRRALMTITPFPGHGGRAASSAREAFL